MDTGGDTKEKQILFIVRIVEKEYLFYFIRKTNMPTLTDKLIREAVESFDGEFINSYGVLPIGTSPEAIKSFISAQIRQAVDETKERLTIEIEDKHYTCMGVDVIEDLEELKKTI